ncbi:uncharacterized protein EDB91DRAFT_1333171 [Suillus paluster]|uniref:uncharacterized protein n=1 Tax=Suillus paluster TaxID=48578 RepID=UPI001B87F8FA|nr:uncharacterized protein EDB91DRAFT_1333171 [Suillus paluster]KAG1753803.1 hypothetical protein EDB91DRAFT_1333171 [Suillus paluster]
MTVMYLSVRYAGMPYVVMYMLGSLPSVSLTDVVSNNLFLALNWMNVVVTVMVGAIMITRLHAMYQRSRKMIVFLFVISLALTVACALITARGISRVSGEEFILSDTYQCTYDYEGDSQLLMPITWILRIVWEVLALCLAVWISVRHFRELRRLSGGSSMGDCFVFLMRTHVVYFATFAAGSCIALVFYFPTISDSDPMGYNGVLNIFSVLQMFVLGPRLILCVREYHAELVADAEAESNIGTGMTSNDSQEYTYMTSWQCGHSWI